MTDVNPYSTPTTFESEPIVRETPSTRRLWIAYGIAPLVAPLVSAIAVFVTGSVYLANHPEDTGTPIGIIMVPIALLIAGVPASYGVAGVIGMPIALLLRKYSRLNGYTVHGAALLWAAVLALGVTTVAQIRELPGFIELLAGAFFLFLLLTPFILLSATTFWLIGVRQRKRVLVSDLSCSIE